MNLQNQVDYLQELESVDIFEGLTVPTPLNAETAKSAIMIRCGLLTPVYSEPQVMKAAIAQWSTRMQWTFQHLINIIQAEYSPIENTDRYSEHTTENEGGSTRTHSGTDTRNETHGGTTSTADGGNDTTTNEVSAYNSSGYQSDRKETVAHGMTETVTHGKTVAESTVHGLSITDENSGSETYTEHTHGNIGTMTTQTLIEQELALLRHFDIYGFIAEKFESELCLMIY